MPAPARFDDKEPHWPLIVAYFRHPLVRSPRILEFIIDTGADRTLIVPDWQELLDIPKRALEPHPLPILTVAGPVRMDCLSNCTLDFFRGNRMSQFYEVSNLRIFFSPSRRRWWWPWRRGHRLKLGEGKFPNILGRDVLAHLSLGYCKPENYVFLTGRNGDYYQSLSGNFPP